MKSFGHKPTLKISRGPLGHSKILLNSQVGFSHVQLFATPWTVACQAPLSMGFSRQEYWSGLPFPSLGDLPNPGIEPTSLTSPALAGGFFTTSVQFSSVTRLCPTLCDPTNRNTPGLPVHHQLLEFTQTHVHRVGDSIQPSLPLMPTN